MEIEGLTSFDRYLLKKAQQFPKEALTIMRKIGTEARKKALKRGKSEVKKHTGNYQRGWKRGRAMKAANGSFQIEVKNIAPHAHLIEKGHRIVDSEGEEHGFVKGKFVLDKAMREFQENEMEDMLDDWLDDMLDKGL